MANSGQFHPQIPDHHLLCHRCRHFRYTLQLAQCELQRGEFPALCEAYDYDGELSNDRAITDERAGLSTPESAPR